MAGFFSTHRRPFIALVIGAAVATVSGFIALSPPASRSYTSPPPTATPSTTNEATLPSPTGEKPQPAQQTVPRSTAETPLEPAPTRTISASSSVETTAPTIPVTLNISGVNYNVNEPDGSTVYDLLQAVSFREHVPMTFKDFGPGLGYMLESINYQPSDSQKKMYWIYYINNKKATVGISTYTVRSHDLITWKYEPEE